MISIQTQKHLDITNAIIVKKHGCRPILKNIINKDARAVTDISMLYFFGKINIKKDKKIKKRKLLVTI